MHKFGIYTIVLLTFTFFSCKNDKEILTLTERQWLDENPDLKVSIFELYPPYMFVNEDGEIHGLYIDYLDLIEQKIGYKFKRIFYKQNEWPNILHHAKTNNIDLIIDINKTPEREEYLAFFKPLFDAEISLITRKNEFKNIEYKDIKNKSVVIPKDYMMKDFLLKKFPKLNLNYEDTEVNCLKSLNEGKYDVYVGIKAASTFFIEKYNLENLIIRSTTPLKHKPGIAVPKQNKTLTSIINKAVKNITGHERHVIFNKWLLKKSLPFYHNPNFWFVFVGFVVLIVGGILFFNWKLKKIIKEKTKALTEALSKAEESNLLKTAFINNISHEIRTPMNGILGYTELLKNESNSLEQQNDYIENISKSGKLLVSTIDNLIEVSKLESNNYQLKKEYVNLFMFFNIIIDDVKLKIQNKNINLTLLNKKDTENIFVDKQKLKRSINVIVDNAIKFTKQGKVEISYKIIDSYVDILISDTGIGIDEDKKLKVFESFYQLEKNENNKTGGLGLGLKIAKENIKALNGFITLNSEKNKGSTFKITIPIN